jgi:hypothetical protein
MKLLKTLVVVVISMTILQNINQLKVSSESKLEKLNTLLNLKKANQKQLTWKKCLSIFKHEITNQHNLLRAKHIKTPLLKSNKKIKLVAQKYADTLK